MIQGGSLSSVGATSQNCASTEFRDLLLAASILLLAQFFGAIFLLEPASKYLGAARMLAPGRGPGTGCAPCQFLVLCAADVMVVVVLVILLLAH